ncbi:DEAD/DEAH box helicase [Methylobacterium nonmethylotrophicum]|uniref:DEAD/DEAH box helicase n=1 Tax=Methylobacterium nonmethylotrophicum TaxID=1141884 RepID=A0A4Z0NED0_9HYPH|nr:DEAD/DEAH box helicase [Methylobacterium nonmethylotrophicum]TGD94292.1 DEAD/DEAH box helicase [Methylobacterium nonmethylotrophicum]
MLLRSYQRASLDALQADWARGGRNGLIVLPTGAGKSLVIATLVRETLLRDPAARVAVVTHTRELIAQNHAELMRLWPEAPAGIVSAGLGRREETRPILFCGIQSVWNRVEATGGFDLVIVDEAHLIPRDADTRYGRFLDAVRARSPRMRLVGLTATPYRLDSGRLDEGQGRVFDRIVYEAQVGDLIREGYLALLVSKATATILDVSGVPVRAGDYVPGALEAAVNRDVVTRAAVAEMVAYGAGRRAWLAFCAGVKHADAVRDAIRAEGFSCESLSGETGKRERDRIVRDFRAGRLRCLTSVGVLATGFNVPEVDLIALLRPTQSTGLYVQQVGRGLRRAPGKSDALVLDYAGLVRRHGPIDVLSANAVARARLLGEGGGPRAKPCPGCGALIALNASTCEACWVEPEADEAETPHEAVADDEAAILSAGTVAVVREAQARWWPVAAWEFRRETCPRGPDLLAVALAGAEDAMTVRLDLEASGFAREKAVQWWRRLGGAMPAPRDVDEALARRDELARPEAVRVVPTGRLSESVDYRLAGGATWTDTRRVA